MTTLCLDFGNTRLKAAIFDGPEFREEILLANDADAIINDLIKKYRPEKSILSSVIDHNAAIEKLLASNSKFHKLGSHTTLNFNIAISKPDTIGADRLALIAAAVYFFPGKNNLIIASGSCITYNFVNQYNQFLGGSISPGMDMRFKSMQEHTAKLPLVQASWNFPLVGYDTTTNLQSGVIVGMAAEIEYFIEQYGQKYGNFNAVLTGGNSAYFVRQLKNKIFADHNFLFKGLYALSELNNCPA